MHTSRTANDLSALSKSTKDLDLLCRLIPGITSPAAAPPEESVDDPIVAFLMLTLMGLWVAIQSTRATFRAGIWGSFFWTY